MIIFALGASVASAQHREPSPLRFARETHDFGRVREAKGAVSHVFKFTNEGAEPVAVDIVVASCGCTTGDYSRRPIAPGESGEIRVTFEPAGFRGEVEKSISVVSGGRRYSNFLKITGKVK